MTYGQPWQVDNQDNVGGNKDSIPMPAHGNAYRNTDSMYATECTGRRKKLA